MNEHIERLYQPVTLGNGVQLPDRFVMAPMSIEGAASNGEPTGEDLEFWQRRAATASLLITGETNVGLHGMSTDNQLGLFDSTFAGFKKMATVMKSKGNRAILQLFHAGAKGATSYRTDGIAWGPSDLDASVMGYPVTGMSESEIEKLIKDFGHATELAIQAGFDGVEVSANFYLMYNFFSRFFNRRTDKWGGQSIETRSAFTLAVLDEVQRVIDEQAPKTFILGLRVRPENYAATGTTSDTNSGEVNHTLSDTEYLLNEALKRNVAYVHTLQWGPQAYKRNSQIGFAGLNNNLEIKKLINGRVPLIVNGGIIDKATMVDSLYYGDLFSVAMLALVDPDAKDKVATGQTLNYKISSALKLPKNLYHQGGSIALASPMVAKENPTLVQGVEISKEQPSEPTDATTGASAK